MTLAAALNIEDLRRLARARLPRMVFDYIDGGADDEVTLRANLERLRAWRLQHRALVDIAETDLSARVMGQETRLPFFISPTAASRLFQSLRAADRLAGPGGRIAFAPVPETGLGRAINDRLRRAAAPRGL